MSNPTKPTTNLTREELRQAIRKDFHKLLVKEFTADWKIQRLLHDLELDVMYFDNTMQLFDTYTQAKEREAHKDGYMQGVADFSGYYMDASIPAQRNLIMPHIAIELTENYKPAIYRADKENI